ncbi:MAG: hypothetical protein II358_03270 [Tidjanibacter sp.]|nr:hypothetical protein [Tidjanibacter sp.]
MKRNYFAQAVGLIAAVVIAMTACKTPEGPDGPVKPGGGDDTTQVVTPNFPEKIVANVAPGELYKFTIEPNMSWELSIPLDIAAYFKLLDGESSRFTLYGEAGTHEITVQVADKEEFDNARVCEVTLKMDGQEQIIAELTRAAKERSVKAYACQFSTDADGLGVFGEDADGNWAYNTEPMESFDFVWCNDQWMQRLVVDANFKWTLRGIPEWAIFSTYDDLGDMTTFNGSGKAGRTELFVRINDELYPWENDNFTLSFCDMSDQNGDGQITEEDVREYESLGGTLEGCKDRLSVELSSKISFTDKGISSSELEIVYGTIHSPYGAKIQKVAVLADGTLSVAESDTAWVTLTEDAWPTEAKDGGLWSHQFSIEVEDNMSISQRQMHIVVLPKPVAEALGGAENLLEGGALKEQYADYLASTITQEALSLENDTIVPYEKGVMAAYNAKFQTLAEGMWPWIGEWAQIPNAYMLTYKNNDSGSELVFSIPFASYKIFGHDGKTEYTDLESCWITVNHIADNPRGEELCYKIVMRLDNGENDEEEEEEEEEDDQKPALYPNTLAGPNGENEATIVFYDNASNAFALIYCVMDPTLETITGATGEVKFANPTDAATKGATLAPIPESDSAFDKDMHAHGTLQYRLNLTPDSKDITLMLPEYGMVWSYNSAITTTQSDNGKYTYIHVESEASTKGFISYYMVDDPDNAIAVQLQVIYTAEE